MGWGWGGDVKGMMGKGVYERFGEGRGGGLV